MVLRPGGGRRQQRCRRQEEMGGGIRGVVLAPWRRVDPGAGGCDGREWKESEQVDFKGGRRRRGREQADVTSVWGKRGEMDGDEDRVKRK